jgi:RNA polymerase primary sigma factor
MPPQKKPKTKDLDKEETLGGKEGHSNKKSSKTVGGSRTAFEAYMASISNHKILSKDEEKVLGDYIQSGDQTQKDAAVMSLVEHNLKLSATIATEFQHRGIDLEDLISEANIGLRKAAERFDPSFGAKFSTYASWWIKQSIKRFIYNKSRTIRLPIHLIEKISLIRRIKENMTNELGRVPSCDEIAEEMGGKPEEVEKLLNIESQTISIDSPSSLEEPNGTTLGDIIADPDAADPAQEVSDKSDFTIIKELLATIPSKEQEIVSLRFGLRSGESLTLEQIGIKYGVSRERIRQIEADALVRIRKSLHRLETQPHRRPKTPDDPNGASLQPPIKFNKKQKT